MAPNRLALSGVSPDEAVEQIRSLDPTKRYRVVVVPAPSQREVIEELDRVFRETPNDPLFAGLSEDEMMEVVQAEIATYRTETRRKKAD